MSIPYQPSQIHPSHELEYMLQEKGERPTEGDSIMAKVVETIHKAAADAGRVRE